jgi:hypothetical protein
LPKNEEVWRIRRKTEAARKLIRKQRAVVLQIGAMQAPGDAFNCVTPIRSIGDPRKSPKVEECAPGLAHSSGSL